MMYLNPGDEWVIVKRKSWYGKVCYHIDSAPMDALSDQIYQRYGDNWSRARAELETLNAMLEVHNS